LTAQKRARKKKKKNERIASNRIQRQGKRSEPAHYPAKKERLEKLRLVLPRNAH
jgi:hypothetical protein